MRKKDIPKLAISLTLLILSLESAACFTSVPLIQRGCNIGMTSSKEKEMELDKNNENKASAPFDIFGLSPGKPILPIITSILACTRPIPPIDHFFSIFYPLYLCIANRFRFDRNAPVISKGTIKKFPLLREGRGPWSSNYMKTFAIIGILCPLLVQIFAPTSIAVAAAPHLYLTMCQVTMESMAGAKFYPLTRLMVPIGFNVYRLGSLKVWLWTAWQSLRIARQHIGDGKVMVWETAGLVLAFLNTLIWTYNLFVFLLLRTLPQYLDRNEFPDANVSWKGQLVPVLGK